MDEGGSDKALLARVALALAARRGGVAPGLPDQVYVTNHAGNAALWVEWGPDVDYSGGVNNVRQISGDVATKLCTIVSGTSLYVAQGGTPTAPRTEYPLLLQPQPQPPGQGTATAWAIELEGTPVSGQHTDNVVRLGWNVTGLIPSEPRNMLSMEGGYQYSTSPVHVQFETHFEAVPPRGGWGGNGDITNRRYLTSFVNYETGETGVGIQFYNCGSTGYTGDFYVNGITVASGGTSTTTYLQLSGGNAGHDFLTLHDNASNPTNDPAILSTTFVYLQPSSASAQPPSIFFKNAAGTKTAQWYYDGSGFIISGNCSYLVSGANLYPLADNSQYIGTDADRWIEIHGVSLFGNSLTPDAADTDLTIGPSGTGFLNITGQAWVSGTPTPNGYLPVKINNVEYNLLTGG